LWLDRLAGVGDDGGMATWFRTYIEDEDVWQYFEEGADSWASRQVDVRGADSRPLTAASLDEVLHLRDHADLAAMQRYERRFGVLSETALDDWRDAPGAQEITEAEFERLWIEARAVLGGPV
jgi:hypothetical protein